MPKGRGAVRALDLALRAIHGAKLLHRDLKPGNIAVGPDGPVVLDFGLAVLTEWDSDAALTKTGAGFGTPTYMSLEQARDTKHVTESSDIYSLGAVLFFAAAQRPPYPLFSFLCRLHRSGTVCTGIACRCLARAILAQAAEQRLSCARRIRRPCGFTYYLGRYGLAFPCQLMRRVSRARVAATKSRERAFSSSRARRFGSVSR